MALVLLSACSLHRPLVREEMQGLGHFEYREPADGLEGVVIGAPHGGSDRNSDKIARTISDRTGAGLVMAYGFKSRRLSVSQPVVRLSPYPALHGSSRRASVFDDYKRMLQKAAKGEMDLYIGVHRSKEREVADRIEVVTSGLTFEEAKALKAAYMEIRNLLLEGRQAPHLEIAIEPLDKISWRTAGEKHHGVLLIAAKGLNLRVPGNLSPEPAEGLYTEILSRWIDRTIKLLRENPLRLPQIQVKQTDLGKFELVRSRRRLSGIVIGAPHGSYDEYTAEMVKRVSYRTGFAAVIAKGFTPTEADGWRINVNRPTEKTPYSDALELHSQRASRVYSAFKDLVFEACSRDLRLYIDIHQYSTDAKIQVATVGIAAAQARVVKMLYYRIRDQMLAKEPAVPAVDLIIEPLDAVEIGAWAAKREGILSLARKSLHFEIPSHIAFATAETRAIYTQVFAALFRETAPFLLSGARAGLKG